MVKVYETSLVHDIPLKDLNPENVEIDDYCVYSRRTMHRIRSYAPIRIPRPSFALLERYRINARDFVDRDKEVEEMLELRRQSIRCQRMRVELRSKIGDGTDGGVKNVENEMKELSLREMDTQDGLTCEEWLPQIENDDDELLGMVSSSASFVDGTIDTADVVESADTANAVEKQEFKENQPRSLICYEDFFITLKDFDRYSFKTKVDRLEKDCFTYSFDNADNFNNGYKPDMVCASCESPNHWSDACPMMTIPRIEAISHIKLEYEWVELDHVILGTYEKNRMKEHRLEKLGEMVARMRSFLEKDLKRTVRLDNVDGVEIVREISTSLQKMKGLDKVYAITGAKVPIVKFMWPKFGFEGDISYYNVLALYNTQLLKTYCAWDRRVAPIGVWVKRWAKSCDIGDASRGSLSSYAMIILLIHYLQNCEPPVLPRLQEVQDFRNGDVKPILVENHDVYYHKTVLEKWSENRSSVSQLFVGFLDYYARFDFETQVIQIRRRKPLLKMEKDWNRSVCIEDPFDLNHNLGSGVTRKMYVFIVRNIHNSRKKFMLSDIRHEFVEKNEISPDKELPPNLLDNYGCDIEVVLVSNEEKICCHRFFPYLTSLPAATNGSGQYQLTEIVLLKECEMGSAPSDRQCRICHRVGHFAESCPKVGDEETRATNVAKDELVEGDFRNQHGLRTFRREPWPRKAPRTERQNMRSTQ
ncbi:zinc knuckle [Ancylostoma ceylanicum]|uniref:Zinc knuckle n=1 Tax=Ancylostoma ceylanicum TaxID=53326 RepID=A0A0D6LCS9_9BILA|nr:zinc knuckle [Ancylostoma ceylanicum]